MYIPVSGHTGPLKPESVGRRGYDDLVKDDIVSHVNCIIQDHKRAKSTIVQQDVEIHRLNNRIKDLECIINGARSPVPENN